MKPSSSMLGVAVVGLVLGTPMALAGWEGLRGIVLFLQEESDRLLGIILVCLSIAVLVRQVLARGSSGRAAPASAGRADPPSQGPSSATPSENAVS